MLAAYRRLWRRTSTDSGVAQVFGTRISSGHVPAQPKIDGRGGTDGQRARFGRGPRTSAADHYRRQIRMSRPTYELQTGLRHTETWFSESFVKGLLFQSA